MREYELNFIIQPEISEEGSKVILERLDAILAASTGERLLCDDLGKRKLSYEIRKFQKGHYYVLSFLDDGTTVPDLERALRLDESVLRYLTVKVSDVVTDIEGRKAAAKEREIELHRRAAEKSAREAEEAQARADAERTAAAEAASVSDSISDDDDDDDDSDDDSDDDDDDDDEEDDR